VLRKSGRASSGRVNSRSARPRDGAFTVPRSKDDRLVNFLVESVPESRENCATHTNALQRGKFLGDNPLRPIANPVWRHVSRGAESPFQTAKSPAAMEDTPSAARLARVAAIEPRTSMP